MSKAEKNVDMLIRQEAFEFGKEVYKITANESFYHAWGLRDQIERAAISVMSNITEGFERYSEPDYARILTVAHGSCAEVKAQPYLVHSLNDITGDNFRKFLELCSLLSGSIGKCGGSMNRRGIH